MNRINRQKVFEQKRIHYKVWSKMNDYIHKRHLNVSIRNGRRYIVVKFLDMPLTEKIIDDVKEIGGIMKIRSGIKYHKCRYEAIYPILNSKFLLKDEKNVSIQIVNDNMLTDKNVNPYRNEKRDIYE